MSLSHPSRVSGISFRTITSPARAFGYIGSRETAAKLLPVATLIGLAMVLFPSAGRDDAYITFWASYSLSNFGELVNYNGEPVEQSSSIFHVLLLALLSKATSLSLPTAGALLSVASAALALVYTYALASLFVGRALAMAAGLIVATSAYFAYGLRALWKLLSSPC